MGPTRVDLFVKRALQGAFLALGAPLGWLGLRLIGGAQPGREAD